MAAIYNDVCAKMREYLKGLLVGGADNFLSILVVDRADFCSYVEIGGREVFDSYYVDDGMV